MEGLKAIELEKRENSESLYKMHLYREESGWWRGYELSAYFAHFYPNKLSDNDKLKAIRRSLKGSENGIISVGVRLESFQKYFPDIKIDDNNSEINDGHIVLDLRDYFSEKINFENHINILKEWKEQFKIVKTSKKTEINSFKLNECNDTSLKIIFQQIMGYPLENKTPMENTAFLSDLKIRLSKILC